MAAPEAGQQLGSSPQVVGLAGGENQTDRQAVLVDDGVDLGTQSATRTADGVIFAPFLPPAAC
jgi:predicted TIM-barrel enzyme